MVNYSISMFQAHKRWSFFDVGLTGFDSRVFLEARNSPNRCIELSLKPTQHDTNCDLEAVNLISGLLQVCVLSNFCKFVYKTDSSEFTAVLENSLNTLPDLNYDLSEVFMGYLTEYTLLILT